MVQTPKLVQWLFPQRVWAFPRTKNDIYLTFDDGPIPEVTPWVLEVLKEYNAKATFFCIGDNIRKHPEIFNAINAQGHRIGNHTYHHINGKDASLNQYVADVVKTEETINELKDNEQPTLPTKLFRPPYGKLKRRQAKAIQELGYRIVMWDVLSADFDTEISEEKCLRNVMQHIKPGSIVVFHDSIKAEKNLRYVLPKVLAYLKGVHLRATALT